MPADGTGVKLTVFLQPLELGIMKWGLARRFGPLNGLRSAQESPQVGAPASGLSHAWLRIAPQRAGLIAMLSGLCVLIGVPPTIGMNLRSSCICFCRTSTCMQSSDHESCSDLRTGNKTEVGKFKLSVKGRESKRGCRPTKEYPACNVHVRSMTCRLPYAQASFSQNASARLLQSAVILSVGLAVLLLLRAALKRFYGRRREAAGASMHSPARRSPLKP